jgi:hypothetical protein
VQHVHLKRSYDVIICSEVLYYTEHESMIDKFIHALTPLGVLIISLHMPLGKPLTFDAIFQYAERRLALLDVIEVGGRKHPPAPEMTMFRIKVFRNQPANATVTASNSHNHNSSSVATTT